MADLGQVGVGPGAGLRFAPRRGRSLSGTQIGNRFPSPFFDIAQTYLPTSVKNQAKWLRYYFFTNPLINAVCTKMAEYPITALSYDTDNEALKTKWKRILEDDIDIAEFLTGAGLDYYVYGNCFISISFPFKKYLRCSGCKEIVPITDATYKFRDYLYLLSCAKCGLSGPARVIDRYIRSMKGVHMIRWDPTNIGIKHNNITGKTIYTYDMPVVMKNDILLGKAEAVESIPHQFIEAMRLNRAIQFNDRNMMHLQRPHLAEQDQGWGMPLPMPVLKDVYYLQVLKKAQEAIANTRITPLEVLFPQPSASTGDPYSMADLSNWARKVEEEIARWRFDAGYIPIMPLPIGHQVIGGDGRAMLLHQEIRLWSEQIVIGMGVPIEFIFGGASWTGSNVSMRMIENQFLKYRRQQLRLVRWIVTQISTYMNWPGIEAHFTDFKMADDLQRKSLLLNLATMNKVSDRTLLDEFDLDYTRERKQLEGQFRYDSEYQKQLMVSQAEAQGEASVVAARYAEKTQMAEMGGTLGGQPGEQPNDPAGVATSPISKQPANQVGLHEAAKHYAKQLSRMPQSEQQRIISELRQRTPQLATLVMQALAKLRIQGGAQPGMAQPGQAGLGAGGPKAPALARSAAKPLPEQRPPRRLAVSI